MVLIVENRQALRLRALLVAGCVMTSGFGVMATWAALGGFPENPPSFIGYISRTVGDGLFLSVLVYGLSFATGATYTPRRPAQKVLILMGVCTGAGLGAAAQLTWYLDEAPRRNWLLPEPGIFSAAGWYHAVYSVLCSSLIAFLFVSLAVNIWESQKQPEKRQLIRETLSSNGTAVVCTAGGLFLASVTIDSLRSYDGLATHGTLAALATSVAMILAMIAIAARRSFRLVIGPTVVSSLTSLAFFDCITGQVRTSPMLVFWLIAVIAAGIGAGFRNFGGGSILRSCTIGYTLYPAAAVLVVPLSGLLPPSVLASVLLGLGLLVVIGASVAWAYVRKDHIQSVLANATFLIVLITVAMSSVVDRIDRSAFEAAGKLINSSLGLVVPLVISVYCTYAIKWFWVPLVAAEQAPRTEDNRKEVLRTIGIESARAFVLGLGLSIGAFLSAVSLIFFVVDNTVSLEGRGYLRPTLPVIATLCLFLALFVTFRSVRLSFKSRPMAGDLPQPKQSLNPFVKVISLVALASVAAASFLMAAEAGWHGGISLVAFCVMFILSVDVAEGCLINCTFLCFERPRRSDMLAAALVGTCTGSITYWATMVGAGMGGLSIGPAIIVLATALAARGLAIIIGAALIYASGNSWYATDRAPAWNQLMDESIRAVLIIAVVWLPIFVFVHSDPGYGFFNVLVVGGGSVVLATALFPFASEQLMRHYDDQCEIRFNGRFRSRRRTDVQSWFASSVRLFSGYLDPMLRQPKSDQAVVFIVALGAHLAFEILVRLLLVATTVVGFVMFVLSGLILGLLPAPPTANRAVNR